MRNSFFIPYFKDILLGKVELKDSLTAALLKAGYAIKSDEVMDIWFNKESQFDDNILKLISELKIQQEVKLYIASNQSKERANFLWNEKRLKDHFIDYYISSDLKEIKNNSSFFNKINTCIGSGKKILVDDAMNNIIACQEAGWLGIHYQSINSLVRNPHIKQYLVGSEVIL